MTVAEADQQRHAAGAGIPFAAGELSAKLGWVLRMSAPEREEWKRRAAARIRERYSWESVTEAYENLLLGLAKRRQ